MPEFSQSKQCLDAKSEALKPALAGSHGHYVQHSLAKHDSVISAYANLECHSSHVVQGEVVLNPGQHISSLTHPMVNA